MAPEKALALVLRVVEFSESSSIVTLFTREEGKIEALAKGARRPKGPFESALDLLCLCRVVSLRKSSGSLDLLTEAKLERRFRGRNRDLSSIYAGYYVAELLTNLTDVHDPHPRVFEAANRTLMALMDPDGENVASLVIRFEVTALRELGHMPSLDRCVECGQWVRPAGRVAFSELDGGVLCGSCRPGKRNVVSISPPSLEALRTLGLGIPLDSNAANVSDTDDGNEPIIDRAGDQAAEIDPRVVGELRGVLNHYVSHLMGRKPRLLRYLKAL
jgi:DNA repair protein RecO (recombination protein O)